MHADQIIGERVHQLMWRGKVPQRVVAEAVGLHQASLSKKLHGERPWSIDEVLAVAAFLNVPITDLLPEADYVPELSRRGRIATARSLPAPSSDLNKESEGTGNTHRYLRLVVANRDIPVTPVVDPSLPETA